MQQQQWDGRQLTLQLLRACAGAGDADDTGDANGGCAVAAAGQRMRKGPSHSWDSTASTLVPSEAKSGRQQQVQAAQSNGHASVGGIGSQRRRQSPSTSSDFPATVSSAASPEASDACSLHSDFVSPFTQSPFTQSPQSEASAPSQCRDERSQLIERVLCELCDEFELRLRDRFADFGRQLDTHPASIRDFLHRELETLFHDGCVHWGRVLAVFVLCRQLCYACRRQGRPHLPHLVQLWTADFIDERLWGWIRQQGGWYGVVQFHAATGGSGGRSPNYWAPVATFLTLAALSIGIAAAASYLRR